MVREIIIDQTAAMYIAESKLRMLSPTARTRMWDADADGYARGEGIASVVLKPLSAALADGDPIECIIRATAVNQDGRTAGLTMPSSTAQAALIRETYLQAGLNIEDPNDHPHFFHAHGTGTPAGDPQEAKAISHAFFGGDVSYNEKLYVGSLKTIIGHTEGTAGLASLIGTVQAIQHGVIPPNMHFKRLSEKIAPFYTHLEIPTVAKSWPALREGQVRRASINSFGESPSIFLENNAISNKSKISAERTRIASLMLADQRNRKRKPLQFYTLYLLCCI